MSAEETSENAELLALQRIDETCVSLQEQGRYLEALECMERGLVLRQHFFGADSDEVWRACKTVGEMCNLLAMTYLQQDDFAMVLELLKKAEILTERDQVGWQKHRHPAAFRASCCRGIVVPSPVISPRHLAP